ncbi:MAG: hypothetical protein FIA89_00655 [Geobacter sp.]|nr:hypothetical protein [Geobacter sp.]
MRLIMITLLVAISVFSSNSYSETYSWEDERGLHFTDNYNSVPPKYRNKITVGPDVSPSPYTPNKSISLQDKRRSYTYETPHKTYDECVAYEEVNIKLQKDIPAYKAYRQAILFCNKLFGINSVKEYSRGYNEIDDRIRR